MSTPTMKSRPRQYILTEEIEKYLSEIKVLKADFEKQLQINLEAHDILYRRLTEQLGTQREEILRLQREIQELKEEQQSRNNIANKIFYSE